MVDDDVAVGLMLHRMLSDEQNHVQISQSVAEAVGAIEQKSFDVYVTDYKLTDGTGLDVAERVRSKGSEAPIILISGYDPAAVALRAEKLSISTFFEKSFSREIICEAVKKAIGSPKAAPKLLPVDPPPSPAESSRPSWTRLWQRPAKRPYHDILGTGWSQIVFPCLDRPTASPSSRLVATAIFGSINAEVDPSKRLYGHSGASD